MKISFNIKHSYSINHRRNSLVIYGKQNKNKIIEEDEKEKENLN